LESAISVTRHLALVHRPEFFSAKDYEAIAAEIGKRCDDIRVFIAQDVRFAAPPPAMAARPLMTFSPAILTHFKPPRGKVFSGQKIEKDEQLRLLAKGGVRVPKWTYAEPGLRLSEAEWGPHVIIKPIRFGHASKGRDVELARTAHFSFVHPAVAKFQGKTLSDSIVQKFIDSGEYSEDYRVVTMFGRPLYALWRKSGVKLVRPDGITAQRTADGVVSNADAGPRQYGYCYDKDVLAFAATCYRAIPQVPFQAVDVRRDINDGRLYCLEINPGGKTWNFSSPRADKVPLIDGIRREDQLGAWAIAAETLIENTRLFAS
jgi:hypothetical protein